MERPAHLTPFLNSPAVLQVNQYYLCDYFPYHHQFLKGLKILFFHAPFSFSPQYFAHPSSFLSASAVNFEYLEIQMQERIKLYGHFSNLSI